MSLLTKIKSWTPWDWFGAAIWTVFLVWTTWSIVEGVFRPKYRDDCIGGVVYILKDRQGITAKLKQDGKPYTCSLSETQ